MTNELLWELADEATKQAFGGIEAGADKDLITTCVNGVNAVSDALDAVRTEQYKNECATSIWERGEECAR